MNIYVGNLSYSMTDEDLRSAFAEYGEVSSAKVIMDTAIKTNIKEKIRPMM